MSREANFVLQQGFAAPPAASCSVAYSGLLFQPRIVGVVVLVASVLQWPVAFIALGAALLWSGLFPKWNPFDHAYNALFARRSGYRAEAAPPPRRFAQLLAGTLSMAIAALLWLGQRTAAIAIELVLLAAITALVFGGFCLGSYLFHLIRGRSGFANRTLPWSRG